MINDCTKSTLLYNIIVLQPLVEIFLNLMFLRMLDVKNTGGSAADALDCLSNNKVESQTKHFDDIMDDITDDDDDVRNERQRVKDFQDQLQVSKRSVLKMNDYFKATT